MVEAAAAWLGSGASLDSAPPFTSALASAYEFWRGVPFKWSFGGHALYCVLAGPEFKDRWLVHLVLTYLWGNGGGLITALLMQAPQYAPLSFFSEDFIPASWLICWWLVNWAPGGYVGRVCDVWFIKMLLKGCTMMSRALLIPARIDLAVQLFPGVAAAPLILGTIAGCGGRLLADGIMTGWQCLPGLAELTSPGFTSRSAALAAASYYALAYGAQLLPPPAAAGLIVTLLMLHHFASELTGLPLDFTAPVAELLHTITRVPPPPPQPALAPAARAKRGQQQQQGQCSTPAKASTPAKSPASSAAKTAGAASPAAAPAPPPAAAAASPTTARKRRGGAAGTSSSAAAAAAAAAASEEVGGVATRRSQRRAARAAAPAYA